MLDIAGGGGKAGRVVDDAGGQPSFLCERDAQADQHLLIWYRDVPVHHDFLGARENLGIDDRVDDSFATDPEMIGVADLLLPQPPGCSVMHEVAYIVLVPKDSVNHVGRPRTAV